MHSKDLIQSFEAFFLGEQVLTEDLFDNRQNSMVKHALKKGYKTIRTVAMAHHMEHPDGHKLIVHNEPVPGPSNVRIRPAKGPNFDHQWEHTPKDPRPIQNRGTPLKSAKGLTSLDLQSHLKTVHP